MDLLILLLLYRILDILLFYGKLSSRLLIIIVIINPSSIISTGIALSFIVTIILDESDSISENNELGFPPYVTFGARISPSERVWQWF